MISDLPYTLRYSPRARRLRIVVRPPSVVEVVVPVGMGEAEAVAVLAQNRAWVERQLAGFAARPAPAVPALSGPGATVPFQGREVPLVLKSGPGRRLSIVRHGEGPFEVVVPVDAEASGDEPIRAALLLWVRRWMQVEAARMAKQHGGRHGLVPREIRVKRMKSRWGSCGPGNDMNLNWLLAFAPPSVLEYVVVHELCHIRHRDHSAAFWALVTDHLPNWRAERAWLGQHGGALLRRFG